MMTAAGRSQHHLLKKVYPATWRVMRGVFLFSVCINLLMLAVPMYMLQLFDRVVATRSTDTLVVLSMMVVVSILAMSALEAVRGRLMMALGGWMDRVLSGALLDGSIAGANQSGEGTAQALRDLGNVRGFLTGPGLFPVLDAVWVPIFLGIVYIMHPVLGLISIIGAVILFGFAMANDLLTRRALQAASYAANKALDAADAAVRNADVVEALGMRHALTHRWSHTNAEASELQAVASRRSGIISACAKFVRLLVQVGILGVGARLALDQAISPGTMIAASIIMGRGLAPIEQSIQGWRGLISAKAAFSRLVETLGSAGGDEASTPLPRPKGRLTVDQVTFVPPQSETPILKRISFEVEPGEVVGLIGPTAAGKTTLSRLLVGSLKPSLGQVALDGVDMAAWLGEDRGKYIGYLPQDIELFDGTVRDNLSRLSEADDEEIITTARLAGIHDMVLGLPLAYDTPIGASGAKLSGGQRQRLALARALFGNPVLVVLDEPNSNLDRNGEQELMNAVQRLKAAGTTVVLVVQHAAVLSVADKVLVLKDGSVTHFGPRQQILEDLGYGATPVQEAAPLSDGEAKVSGDAS